jgi:hypothetical protein
MFGLPLGQLSGETAGDQVGIAVNGGERGAQLIADMLDELALDALRRLQGFGPVAQRSLDPAASR